MVVALSVWGILNGLFAIGMAVAAKSAIHEIEAGLGYLMPQWLSAAPV